MAYKDSAKKSYKMARREIAYAKSIGKPIILGAETGRFAPEPDASYYGRSSVYLYEQLNELVKLVNYDNFGLSIHHISPWYSMAQELQETITEMPDEICPN